MWDLQCPYGAFDAADLTGVVASKQFAGRSRRWPLRQAVGSGSNRHILPVPLSPTGSPPESAVAARRRGGARSLRRERRCPPGEMASNGMKMWASAPMVAAYMSVPTPTVPPSNQPNTSTGNSIPLRTTRIEWPRAARPVISPSRGPVNQQHGGPAEHDPPRGRDEPHDKVDGRADDSHIGERPQPGALAQRDPEQENGGTHDDRPGADTESESTRQSLLEDVPRVDAETREQQHRVAHPIEDQASQELSEPSRPWCRNHDWSRLFIRLAWLGKGQSARSGGVIAVSGARLVELLGDWRVGGSARDRLAARLRGLVLDAQIPLETRLPSERALAAALGASRSTVSAAYDQLRAEGYLRSCRGSGSFAAVPGGHRGIPDALAPRDGIDLRIAALPAPPILEQLVEAAVADLPRWLDHHGYDPLGLPPLRRAIAGRFTARGLPTRPEQVLVTNGALQALDLTVRALAPRGRSVIVEVPTYPSALDVLRSAHTRLRFVPVTAAGWDLDAFEASTRGTSPALAYLIPDFQNPTGALMDVPTRRRMLGGLARAGITAVIDETFAELRLDELNPPPPATGKEVITLGSLSKAAWGVCASAGPAPSRP